MVVHYYKMVQILITCVLIGGSAIMGLVSSGTQCFIMGENCDTFLGSLGGMIFTPQERISMAVEKLSDDENINNVPIEYRTDYINSQKQQIFFGTFVSLLWLYFAYVIFSLFPGMIDLGTRILIFGFIILLLGMVQGMYAYYVNGCFVIPWSGFIDLLMNPGVLTVSTDYSVELMKDIRNPLM